MTAVFDSSELNQATCARRQIFSSVRKASVWHHTLNANSMHNFCKNRSPIDAKINSITLNEINILVVNMFDCGRIAFNEIKYADIKISK